MAHAQTTQNLDGHVRTARIIAGAMMGGVTAFAIVLLVSGGNRQPGDPMLAYLAVVVTLAVLTAQSFVPGAAIRGGRRALESEVGAGKVADSQAVALRLARLYLTRMIIKFALLEGAAFFVLVAYAVSARTWLFGLAAVLLAVMAFAFPGRGRLESWIHDQLQLMRFEQDLK
jgi:hypothetical protein